MEPTGCVTVRFPRDVTTALEGMAVDRREAFIIRAVAETLARHRRVEVLRSAAGLWDTYDWLPRKS